MRPAALMLLGAAVVVAAPCVAVAQRRLPVAPDDRSDAKAWSTSSGRQGSQLAAASTSRIIDKDDNRQAPALPPSVRVSTDPPSSSTPDSDGRAQNTSFVGLLRFSYSGSTTTNQCTGWLVDRDVVVTALHCLIEANPSVRVTFDLTRPSDESHLKWYGCATLAGGAWGDVDLLALRCGTSDDMLGDRYGMATLATATPPPQAGLYVVHQYCNYLKDPSCVAAKKTCDGVVLQASYSEDGILPEAEFTHDVDTLWGSSGAPIFARSGAEKFRVIGMHRDGCTRASNCAAPSPDGKGDYNMAIKVETLRERLGQVVPRVQ